MNSLKNYIIRRKLLTLCLILISFQIYSQNFQWGFNIRDIDDDSHENEIIKIECDSNNNVYVFGHYDSSNKLDFDPSSEIVLNPKSVEGYFVAKYNESGELDTVVHLLTHDGMSYSRYDVENFLVTQNGEIFIEGWWSGYVRILGNLLSFVPVQVNYIAKINKDMTLKWVNSFPLSFKYNISLEDENLIISGTRNRGSGSFDVDPKEGETNIDSEYDLYTNVIVTWDLDANFKSVFVDTTYNNRIFDYMSHYIPKNGFHYFLNYHDLSKLSPDFSYVFFRFFSCNQNEIFSIKDMCVDENENIHLVAYLKGTLYVSDYGIDDRKELFNTNGEHYLIYIIIDSSGNIKTVKKLISMVGGDYFEDYSISTISFGQNCNLYISLLSKDRGTYNGENQLIHLDEDGNIVDTIQLDEGFSFLRRFSGNNGEYYFAGLLNNMVDIDFGINVYNLSPENNNSPEMFLSKLKSYSTPTYVEQKQIIQPNIMVYPIPAKDRLMIESMDINIQDSELTITDILGKTCVNSILEEESNTVSVSHLKTGVYFLTIRNMNWIYQNKFIKE